MAPGWRLAFLLLLALVVPALAAVLLPGAGVAPGAAAQQQAPRTRSGAWQLSSVDDWRAGVISGLLVSNNAGGELRLNSDQSVGVFVSQPLSATFGLNAAGAFWRAELPPGTALSLEVRGRTTPPTPDDITGNAGWGPWRALVAGDARVQAEGNVQAAFAVPAVVDFPPGTTHLQVRASFSSALPRASALLQAIQLVYFDTTEGAVASPGLPRIPAAGPATLTTPPRLVPRSVWGTGPTTVRPVRLAPRGIILHQIDVLPATTDPLMLLRALTLYQTETLGWDDLAYHYLIDEAGTLYAGRVGGPLSFVPRLAGGDRVVHVALIGAAQEEPSAAAQDTLVRLFAWLGQAYTLPPLGEHMVLVGNNPTPRQNIAAHNEVVPEAAYPGPPLRDLVPSLRTRADQATVRARWYFSEGNVRDYTQRLAFFNPTENPTEARVTLFPAAAEPVTRSVAIDAGGRTALLVNEVVSATANLPVVVEANAPLITERTIGLATDLDIGPGSGQPSRVWYFAEGSTEDTFETFLVLFNPQEVAAEATITYMRSDGSRSRQQVELQAGQQTVVRVGERFPGVSFGARIVASQPIVAERTMRFGPDDVGLHNAPGITELSRRWFFAEGTTQAPFEMRILLLNPNQQRANALITFMTPDGTSLSRRYAIPPTTRLMVDVNEVVPELGVATLVEADRPLAAERALYFARIGAGPGEPAETGVLTRTTTALVGTVSFGATEPAFSWRFAGAPTATAGQYLLISNPSRGQARVTVEFLLDDGSSQGQALVMPAGSRYTLAVHELYPDQEAVAVVVRSTQPIVAERSLFSRDGVGAGGGTTSLGVAGP